MAASDMEKSPVMDPLPEVEAANLGGFTPDLEKDLIQSPEDLKSKHDGEGIDSESVKSDSKEGENEESDDQSTRRNSTSAALPTTDDTAAAAPPPTEDLRHSIFPKGRRNFIVFMAAWCAFMSPMTSNIYFPALNQISADLHISQSDANLSLTTFMIFQGLAPAFMGDLADSGGRRPAYIIGFIIYTCACIGLALQTSFPALLVLRAVQASGSSTVIALAAAVAADVSTAAQRGTYMGIVQGGQLAGPAIAPVVGGILAQFLGWRAIFWYLAILGGLVLIPLLGAFPETGRNVVGNGSIPPQPWNRDLLSIYKERKARKSMTPEQITEQIAARDALAAKRKLGWPNPLKVLKVIKEKDVSLLLIFSCILYCTYFCVISSLPSIFQKTYGFNDLQVGLCFIPYGVGALAASLLNGQLLDWRFKKVAEEIGFSYVKGNTMSTRAFPLERVRLPIAFVLSWVGGASVLCYGWAMQVNAPLAAPLVILFFIGYFINGGYNCCSVAVVDYYPDSPATATAANNLVRCLFGALFTAVILDMIDAMGRGWCFTFISFLVFLGSSCLIILMRYGPRWREERAQRMDAAREAKKAREAAADEEKHIGK